jgi:WXXGXW repeat (2 copies)
MKTKLLAFLLLAGGTAFAGPRFSFGVRVGGYLPAPAPIVAYAPMPAPVVAYAPPCPGPGYTWVAGYWYPAGQRWAWRAGYWTRPPYARGYWVAPHYYGRSYYPGYWRR